MIKKTFAALSVATLAAGAVALPTAMAKADSPLRGQETLQSLQSVQSLRGGKSVQSLQSVQSLRGGKSLQPLQPLQSLQEQLNDKQGGFAAA